MSIQHTGSKLVYFPITAIMVIVIMTTMDNQKSASNSSSKNSDSVAAREAAPAKESFTAKLHRWFDIRQMNVAGRYTFLGIVIIFTVLLFFFLGLAIDFALQQPATMALWGIGLGTVISLIFTWRQLMKLIDKGTQQTKSKSNSSSSRTKTKAKRHKGPKHQNTKRQQPADAATELAKLSPEEQRILTEASMANVTKDK